MKNWTRREGHRFPVFPVVPAESGLFAVDVAIGFELRGCVVDGQVCAGAGIGDHVTLDHEAVHAEGGLAGVHVCANTDWSVLLESPADMISFDAYSFFDKFILYADLIKKFIEAGKILAWGIVPTGNPEDIKKETADSLLTQWKDKFRMIEDLGVGRTKILDQSLITPSCGTGSLNLDLAKKVLRLTADVSHRLKKMYSI